MTKLSELLPELIKVIADPEQRKELRRVQTDLNLHMTTLQEAEAFAAKMLPVVAAVVEVAFPASTLVVGTAEALLVDKLTQLAQPIIVVECELGVNP